jgi:hypothetical protein
VLQKNKKAKNPKKAKSEVPVPVPPRDNVANQEMKMRVPRKTT